MSHNAFLKISGLDAQTIDPQHPGAVRLLGFEHDLELPAVGSAGMSGLEGSAGRTHHGDFCCIKRVDDLSPPLSHLCCTGQRLSDVTVSLCDTANSRDVFMRYQLRDVLVRRIRPRLPLADGMQEGTQPAMETIHLRYGAIAWTYSFVGKLQTMGNISFSWNAGANLPR